MRALFYFFLILAVFFLVLFVHSRVRQFRQTLSDTFDSTSDNDPTADQTGKMVACEVCGLHLPENEAVSVQQNDRCHHYCSEAHRDQARQT